MIPSFLMTELVPYQPPPDNTEFTQEALDDAVVEAADDFIHALTEHVVGVPEAIYDELETLSLAVARSRDYVFPEEE